MANEIVKYSNQFNAQALRRFTALDLDLLMAIAARVRDKEIDEVTFTFEELRRLAHVKKNLTDKELAARIVEVNDRLLACRFKFQDDSRTVQFTLFSGFETDWKTAKLLVAVNPRFSFLLNDLTSQFTRFELAEFTALKSSYAKETYRRLKQYRQTGIWKVSIEEFRRLLDVPESYQTRDLNKRVLKPIQDELDEITRRINGTPLKVLGWLTPAEAWDEQMERLAAQDTPVPGHPVQSTPTHNTRQCCTSN